MYRRDKRDGVQGLVLLAVYYEEAVRCADSVVGDSKGFALGGAILETFLESDHRAGRRKRPELL